MNTKKYSFAKNWQSLIILAALMVCFAGVADPANARGDVRADRAVEIARQSKDKVERSGKLLQASSHDMFAAFAQSTATFQQLLDARQQLEDAGFLSPDDQDGRARRAHINARILTELGELKNACDKHLENLLTALDSFDRAVSDSVVDTQATRSINSNYELSLERYLKQERENFHAAAKNAEEALHAYENATAPAEKRQHQMRYNRIRKQLVQIEQRRKLYESRVKVAEMNQVLTGMIRDKIRRDGTDIPEQFRSVMTNLYTLFSKIVPVAEAGVLDGPDALASLGFENLSQIRDILGTVDDSTNKLSQVIDGMVNEMIGGLDGIRVVDDIAMTGGVMSVEDEMAFIYEQRIRWRN
jgi:hypothetical protein